MTIPKNSPISITPLIRFGIWSDASCLVRAPVLPGYHYREIQHKGERLLEVVRHYAADVPFEFRDYYELWLLDENTWQPLALLDSVCCDRDIYDNDLLTWRAGNLCRSQFKSDAAKLADDFDTHADLLNQRLIHAPATAHRHNGSCAKKTAMDTASRV
jgi:hypothetical protein